jgi:hypothetical protein
MEAKQDGGLQLGPPPAGADNSTICYSCGQPGHFKANCPRMQSQRWAVGVRAEAKASGDKGQGVSPEEEAEVVNWD